MKPLILDGRTWKRVRATLTMTALTATIGSILNITYNIQYNGKSAGKKIIDFAVKMGEISWFLHHRLAEYVKQLLISTSSFVLA